MTDVDPGSGLAILGAAIGAKDIVGKVLGPTAEYIGDGLRHWTERRVENVARIFEAAHRRLGDDAEGAVHPQVLKEILDSGSFCDEPLTAEYYGGVLASSKSGVSRDDRGAAFARLVGQLTSYQIRTHFIFYRLIKDLNNGAEQEGELLNVQLPEGRERLTLFMPFETYHAAMDFTDGEDATVVLSHVSNGLEHEDLGSTSYGPKDILARWFDDALDGGLIFIPSSRGVELFYWAHGLGGDQIGNFLSPTLTPSYAVDIAIPPGYRAAWGD